MAHRTVGWKIDIEHGTPHRRMVLPHVLTCSHVRRSKGRRCRQSANWLVRLADLQISAGRMLGSLQTELVRKHDMVSTLEFANHCIDGLRKLNWFAKVKSSVSREFANCTFDLQTKQQNVRVCKPC